MIYDLESLREIQIYGQCPYCFEDMADKNIIGHQVYDVVRIGHSFGGKADVFECPVCFEKSFCHSLEGTIYE